MPFKTQENDRRKVLYIPLALLFAVISSNCSTDGGIPLVGRAPVPIIDISSTNSWYLPGTTIMLDASNSFDPDGKIQSVQWRIIDGESTPLKNDTNPSTEFVVTHEMAGQTSVIELQVTDDSGNRANITTNLSFTQPLTPYAQFEYETVPVSGESSILDGNFSLDQYGSELFFKWDQTGGPDNLQMEIVDHGKLEVSVPFSLQPPEYEMTLTVSNISGLEKKTSRTFTPISPVTCQDCPSNNMELSDSGHIEMPDVTVIEGIFETTALVANEHDNLISLIDLATSEIIKKYDFFDVPSDILYVPEQDKAYVSLTNTPQLGVIDLGSEAISSIPINIEIDDDFGGVDVMQYVDNRVYFSFSTSASRYKNHLASIDHSGHMSDHGPIDSKYFIKIPNKNELLSISSSSSIFEFGPDERLSTNYKGYLIPSSTYSDIQLPGSFDISPDGLHIAVPVDRIYGNNASAHIRDSNFNHTSKKWIVGNSPAVTEFSPNSDLLAITERSMVSIFQMDGTDDSYASKMTITYPECYDNGTPNSFSISDLSFSHSENTYLFGLIDCEHQGIGRFITYQKIPSFH